MPIGVMLHFICTKLRKRGAFVTFVGVWPKQLFERKKRAILKLVSCFLLSVLLLVSTGLVVLVLALRLALLLLGAIMLLACCCETCIGQTYVGLLTEIVPIDLAVSGAPSPVKMSVLGQKQAETTSVPFFDISGS